MGRRFTTTIEVQGKTATFFQVPLDVRAVFGKSRPPVRVTIGSHTYRSTIAVYGDRYFLPLTPTTGRKSVGWLVIFLSLTARGGITTPTASQ